MDEWRKFFGFNETPHEMNREGVYRDIETKEVITPVLWNGVLSVELGMIGYPENGNYYQSVRAIRNELFPAEESEWRIVDFYEPALEVTFFGQVRQHDNKRNVPVYPGSIHGSSKGMNLVVDWRRKSKEISIEKLIEMAFG